MIFWLYVVSAVVVYCIPSYIAHERRDPHFKAILLVNLLLGWTIIGWFAALIMALVDSRRISSLGLRAREAYYATAERFSPVEADDDRGSGNPSSLPRA